MIQRLAEHRIPFLLLVILLLIQSFSIDLNNPNKKPIVGDAQAYYAYLPAIFIYQDLDYTFLPDVQQKYYTAAATKSFLKDVNGQKVNKTFPGITVLYLPFFLTAHGTSILLGLPADGYSFIYQLFYLIGFWFYFLLGLIFLRKVLMLLQFSNAITDLTQIVIVFATNIFFFTVYDQSVTHIYNFFLVNLAVYLFLRLNQQFKLKMFCLFLAVLALIGIIRPTNFLVLGVLLFFVPDFYKNKVLITEFTRTKNALLALLPAITILTIPFILWKLQTGNWIVYSYGEEGFNFLNPELMNFLFSYTKGWFVYTPVMLLILPLGFGILLRKNKSQALIGMSLIFVSVYIFSSWWCWYYGAGLSQRVMIDFYIIPAFLLALILQKIQTQIRPYYFVLIASAVILCIVLNILQSFQTAAGIFPMGSPTKEQYWNNFLTIRKRAEVYPQEHWNFISESSLSLNPEDGQISKGSPAKSDKDWCLRTDASTEYSAVATIPAQDYSSGTKLIFTFDARSESVIEETRLVFVFGDSGSEVFFLKNYISGEWTQMQYLIEFDKDLRTPVDLYLWNAGSKESAEVKNVHWKMYSTNGYF